MTAAQIWGLPAGALAAQLVREGGRCSVYLRPTYDVRLSDGRELLGCGLEGDPEPEKVVGAVWTVVLCSVPGSEYSLRSASPIVTCRRST